MMIIIGTADPIIVMIIYIYPHHIMSKLYPLAI